jgi:hypothetical protein
MRGGAALSTKVGRIRWEYLEKELKRDWIEELA